MVGFPGTIAGTWQQAGRAGRAQQESLAVLIALDGPLDQFLMRQPDYLFNRTPGARGARSAQPVRAPPSAPLRRPRDAALRRGRRALR